MFSDPLASRHFMNAEVMYMWKDFFCREIFMRDRQGKNFLREALAIRG